VLAEVGLSWFDTVSIAVVDVGKCPELCSALDTIPSVHLLDGPQQWALRGFDPREIVAAVESIARARDGVMAASMCAGKRGSPCAVDALQDCVSRARPLELGERAGRAQAWEPPRIADAMEE